MRPTSMKARKRSPVVLRPRKNRLPVRSATPPPSPISDTSEVQTLLHNVKLEFFEADPSKPEPRDKFSDGVEILNRPNAKWRELGIHINFSLLCNEDSVELVQRIANVEFYKCLAKAKVTEAARVEQRREEREKTGEGKVPTARPTDVAFRLLADNQLVCNQGRIFGNVPGVKIGDSFKYKAQLKAIGVHRIALGGIDYLGISICVTGGYEDDQDNGYEMTYTGQGGNDLTGNHRQIADQKLHRGNLALLNNAKYGVPVRVIKKNSNQYIYDGLWDVLSMKKTRGKENKIVFQYEMKRCPGQEPSSAKCVSFREGTSQATVKKTIEPANEICKDFTKGLSRIPVSVVNEVDDELPPGMLLMDLLDDSRGLKQWKESSSFFEFGIQMKMPDGDQVEKSFSDPKIPSEFHKDRHEYLKKLNHGLEPCKADGRVKFAMCILYECGPWLKCPKGCNCEQAITQHQSRWRLQLFRTKKKGWGVRTLDLIPMGHFIMMYIGEVFSVETAASDDAYSFNLTKRPDYTDENEYSEKHLKVAAKYVVTGKRYGNLFRFINHSCDPNCFTQPVLSTHLDRSRPDICLFTMRRIFPGEEISYDYGREYVDNLLENGCRCGSACCTNRTIEV